MANTLLTPDMITMEALTVLHQKATFISSINRQYDDSFAKSGAKIGSTLRIRKPPRYTVTSNTTFTNQDAEEEQVTLSVQNRLGVHLTFTSEDLTMDIDNFSKRFIEPAVAVLAANLDAAALNMYKDVYQQVNNQGSAASFANVMAGRKALVDSLTPPDNRHCLLNTTDNVDLVDALKGLFNPQENIGKNYREGYMGRTAGMDFAETTLLNNHTRGAGAGYLINGGSQTGATLTVDTGTGALKKGDVFTITGVFRVHPETKASTGVLQQFVVTADATTGTTSIAISPAIVTSGGKQNVSGSPADNAAITFAGTASTAHGISLAYHKDAFTFATADLVIDESMSFASRKTMDGISMRLVKEYDIDNDAVKCRLDVLYGYLATRPELAARLANR